MKRTIIIDNKRLNKVVWKERDLLFDKIWNQIEHIIPYEILGVLCLLYNNDDKNKLSNNYLRYTDYM